MPRPTKRKPRQKAKPKPLKTEWTHPAIDRVMLLMVSGLPLADLTEACVSKFGVAQSDIERILAAARNKLRSAAGFNLKEQVGIAVTRLNDLYSRSIRANDCKTALVAQRELNRLMGLGKPDQEADPQATHHDAEELSRQIAAIRNHLIPLALAPEQYPLTEHARIAADTIRDLKAGRPR